MNENNLLWHGAEEARPSTALGVPSALADFEASAATITLPPQRLGNVNNGSLPPHPYDSMPLNEAMRASLHAHSVVNSMFAPSGVFLDRLHPHPSNDLAHPTAMRRPARRALSAPVIDPGKSTPSAALAEAPDSDATISEESSSDGEVGGRQAEAKPPTPQARSAKRTRLSRPVPISNTAVRDTTAGPAKAVFADDLPEVTPLRYYCGEPGCESYRSAEPRSGTREWTAIQAHYRIKHPNPIFDKSKLIATTSKQRSRAMSLFLMAVYLA